MNNFLKATVSTKSLTETALKLAMVWQDVLKPSTACSCLNKEASLVNVHCQTGEVIYEGILPSN